MNAISSIKRMFQSAGNRAPIADMTTKREDGYTLYNARIICAFQADIEALGNSADYDSLRDTLHFARSINEYKLSPIGLMNRYNETAQSILGDRK